MNFRSRQVIKPELNMTQLIDVVLLLLIFFMISSSFVMQPGLNVSLPQASSKDLQPENQLKLLISKDNRLYLDNRKIEIGELSDELQRRQVTEKKTFILIKADEQVRHGLVVQIMDIARSRGLDIGIATRPHEAATSPGE